MTNIETLQTQVDQVAKDLADLKKLTDETLKQTKTEAAAEKVKTAKEEINKKIEALKGLTDATSKADLAKLEAMLKTLESSDTELETLKAGIIAENNTSTPAAEKTEISSTTTTTEITEEKPEEKKNWFKRQRDGFSDSTEENHIRKNVGRVAMGVGAGVLVYKGLKWLFGGGKKKEKKEAKDGEDNDGEEKGFWEKPFGKFLKWTGIGTGAYYLIHGLKTGRWGLSDFFNWDKKNETNPEDIKAWYDTEVSAELKPKYEKFGGLVDDYRKKLNNSDSLGKLKNEKGKEMEMPKGCIPAMLDDAYDNVGDILDTDNYVVDKRKDTGGKLRDFAKSLGSKAAGFLLKPFVGAIKGLKATMFGSDGTPNEEFQKWAETKDLTRDEQVANLMQKYSMVRRYLEDKKEQLARKYAIQQLASENITNPTEEQIQDALSEYKNIITERIQTSFLDKKIATINTGNSIVDTLEGESIYDASASEKSLALTEAVKERKDKIIPDATIWERLKKSPDINKDAALLTELNGVSTRFGAYLKEGLLHRNILEKLANCRGILNFDELWNGKNDDLEEAMDQLGLADVVKKSKAANVEFMNKIAKKTLTKADIEAFETTITDYFNKEQEILLDAETQNNEEHAGNFVVWIEDRLLQLTQTKAGRCIMIVGAAYARFKGVRKVVNGIVSVPFTVFKGITVKPVFRNINVPDNLGVNNRMKLKIYGEDTKFYGKFLNDFKEGKISGETAERVFNARREKWGATGMSFNESLVQKLNLRKTGNLEAIDQASLIKQYCSSNNIRSIMRKNKSLDFGNLAANLNKYDVKVASLSGDNKTFCKALFENAKFKNLDDINIMAKNIDKVDVAGLSSKQIKQLAKDLGKDVSILGDATKVNAKISEIKNTANTATDVVKNLSVEQKKVYNLIADDISQLTKANEALKKTPGYVAGNATEVSNKAKIVKMEDWQLKLKNFDASELDAFAALRKFEFKSNHIIEIFELRKVAAVEKELKKLENGAADVSGLLRQLKASKDAGADISKSLIKTLDDIHTKNLLKSADEVAEFAKDLFKIIAKIS